MMNFLLAILILTILRLITQLRHYKNQNKALRIQLQTEKLVQEKVEVVEKSIEELENKFSRYGKENRQKNEAEN
jgi:hypothetical protein